MRHVLITGTSTGIGYHLTETLLKEGFVVWAGLRSPQAMNPLVEKYPKKLHVLQLDVTSTHEIEQAFRRISSDPSVEEFSLINNAGVAIGGPIEALTMQEWHKLFNVNVFGLIEVTQKFLPLLRRTRGCVINIGSISGRVAAPFLSPYCASKFAVRAFTDSLRREMIVHNVRVVLIEPGPIDTPIWDKSIQKSHQAEQELSAEMRLIYGESLQALEAGVEATAANAVPPSHVARNVLKALNGKSPKPYYLVGKSIRLTAFMVKYLPTGLLDRLIVKGFRGQSSSK
jgi:NAD(P)-dependent dehydrogenase (short-subunit alcohol dehydrogenase family)